jgi:hypothetical protein
MGNHHPLYDSNLAFPHLTGNAIHQLEAGEQENPSPQVASSHRPHQILFVIRKKGDSPSAHITDPIHLLIEENLHPLLVIQKIPCLDNLPSPDIKIIPRLWGKHDTGREG